MREEICQLVLCHTNLVVPWTHQSNCTNASWMRKKCLFEIRHYRRYPAQEGLPHVSIRMAHGLLCHKKSRKCFLVQPGVIRFSNSSICSWTGRVHEVKREAKHATKINSNKSEKINSPPEAPSAEQTNVLHSEPHASHSANGKKSTATGFAPTDS